MAPKLDIDREGLLYSRRLKEHERSQDGGDERGYKGRE
jgi:hypothetical protein